MGNLKGKNPTKIAQYRLLECNDQRTRSHKRERPNLKHKSQNTKDTSPHPSPSFLLSLLHNTSVSVSINEGDPLSIYTNLPTDILP